MMNNPPNPGVQDRDKPSRKIVEDGEHAMSIGQKIMTYQWGNNEKRAQLKGRPCVVLARGTMNSILIEMIDTGEKIVTSRWAVK